ncbi:interferon-induced protein with tetratricopeptide repeats 1-like [Sphaeramia orbicularis]|uniref:interferon-induced protein with tetratricopeptide repeats 1-like n=1 Tax=Sphaeramia orbicularis TaxID=375764 RepID=UPI0011811718|nr:interferon-induced protein with tetratricopeptide repeats 1-like [Sphaeramia orbicularis]
MSAAPPPPEHRLQVHLEALQCHFTWDLDSSRSRLLRLCDNLTDIGSEEGYVWLGHIYNLQGFIHHRLGDCDHALRFFSRAAEAFRQIRNTVSDQGPWLVVNYGNLAWLHHHLGEPAQSRRYLLKVDELMSEHPPPEQHDLHPDVYAEKAWTLMKFGRSPAAADLFQSAIRMQPDHVEWCSSRVLALVQAAPTLDDDIIDRMRIAKAHDPENLYLTALHLEALASRGQNVESEARELATRVLKKPASSYSGIRPLLRLYTMKISTSDATDLAEEALQRHPDHRYLKDCAAHCYNKRILLDRDQDQDRPNQSLVDRAISLFKDVIALYPDSSLKRKISLANIYAKTNTNLAEGQQIFDDLLRTDLDPEEAQMVYNYYAKFLHFYMNRSDESIRFHMAAAEIRPLTFYGEHSLRTLERIRDRNRNQRCPEIRDFLLQQQL